MISANEEQTRETNKAAKESNLCLDFPILVQCVGAGFFLVPANYRNSSCSFNPQFGVYYSLAPKSTGLMTFEVHFGPNWHVTSSNGNNPPSRPFLDSHHFHFSLNICFILKINLIVMGQFIHTKN